MNIQERPSILDFSAGEEAHEAAYQIFTLTLQLAGKFLLDLNVTTKQELEHLQHQEAVELLEDGSRGIVYILTVWGIKP